MVLLEIATLVMAGVGLADYYHTRVYRANLYKLKEKYGEHPNIDDAFEDICTLGGEYFKMPELVLDTKNPHIDMGSFYPYKTKGPRTVLGEFFVTHDEIKYFNQKYEQEVERQAKLRHEKLSKMYLTVEPLYKVGAFETMGSTKMTSRVFKAPSMFAWEEYLFNEVLDDVCKNTIWGEIIEAGPKVYGGERYYTSEWYIKEEIFNKIQNNEVYVLLFKCCYYRVCFNYF